MERALEYFKERPAPKPIPHNDIERKFLSLVKDESRLVKQVLMRSAPKKNPDYSLPEIVNIDMETFMKVYPDWVRWVALDRRYPPTVIRKQPKWLLDAFIYLDSLLDKMTGAFYEQLRREEGDK